MNDTEKQKIREEFEKEFNSLYGVNVSVVNSEPVLIGNPPVADILSFIYSILDKTIKSKLEAMEGIIQKERETWARESIGAKAVESVQNAVSEIINKHK